MNKKYHLYFHALLYFINLVKTNKMSYIFFDISIDALLKCNKLIRIQIVILVPPRNFSSTYNKHPYSYRQRTF